MRGTAATKAQRRRARAAAATRKAARDAYGIRLSVLSARLAPFSTNSTCLTDVVSHALAQDLRYIKEQADVHRFYVYYKNGKKKSGVEWVGASRRTGGMLIKLQADHHLMPQPCSTAPDALEALSIWFATTRTKEE